MTTLTPEMIIQAYAQGLFPMAEPDEDDQLYWCRPERRAILPIAEFHVSRRMARTLRSSRFESVLDSGFESVIRACADREETWLSEEIIAVFLSLHRAGLAHSISVFEEGRLVGGVYGLAMARAFFAESMFHTARDASKAALIRLVEWLQREGFVLLDVQFITDHLRQFGAFEVDESEYERLLYEATAEIRFD
jgi:leucyl/phenylalanyl-tRNA---protein transferase